jgi:hypothetical protein
MTAYREVDVNGVEVFYREASDPVLSEARNRHDRAVEVR